MQLKLNVSLAVRRWTAICTAFIGTGPYQPFCAHVQQTQLLQNSFGICSNSMTAKLLKPFSFEKHCQTAKAQAVFGCLHCSSVPCDWWHGVATIAMSAKSCCRGQARDTKPANLKRPVFDPLFLYMQDPDTVIVVAVATVRRAIECD